MNDPMQGVLTPNILTLNLFSAGSRYSGITTAKFHREEDKTIIYLQRRFLPAAEGLQTLQEHTVTQGERLDHIADQSLGDPLLFWRICDANNALRPEALTETVGRVLRITLPDGITGVIP